MARQVEHMQKRIQHLEKAVSKPVSVNKRVVKPVLEPEILVASVLLYGTTNWDRIVDCEHFGKHFSSFEKGQLANKLYYIVRKEDYPEINNKAKELLRTMGLKPTVELKKKDKQDKKE